MLRQIVAVSHLCWRGDKRMLSKAMPPAPWLLFECTLQQFARCSAATLVPGLLLLLQGLPTLTVACHEHADLQFIFSSLLQRFHWSAKKGPFSISLWLQDQSPLLCAWNPSELWARAELDLSHQGDTWWQTDPTEHHASARYLEVGGSNSS